MTTPKMYNEGARCKGRGFNCEGCKDQNECVEYTTTFFLKPLKHNELSATDGSIDSVHWTPKVVYEEYCNEELSTLPVGILEDMVIYINEVIEKMKKEEK